MFHNSVETHLRFDGIFNDCFIINVALSKTLKGFQHWLHFNKDMKLCGLLLMDYHVAIPCESMSSIQRSSCHEAE